MQFDGNNLIAKTEYTSNQVFIKLLITGGAIASMYSSSYTPNLSEIDTKNFTTYTFPTYKEDGYINMRYSDESNVKTINYNDSFEQVVSVRKEFTEGLILSNIPVNSRNKEERKHELTIIKGSIHEGKEESAVNQLISHRKSVEKVGTITGVVLGTAALIPSFLSYVDWAATLPASLLFFSLTAFMAFRKKLRGSSYGA